MSTIFLGLQFILGGPFWGYILVFLGITITLRGHFPFWFQKQHQASSIIDPHSGVPFLLSKENSTAWIISIILSLLLAYPASLLHRQIIGADSSALTEKYVPDETNTFFQIITVKKIPQNISLPFIAATLRVKNDCYNSTVFMKYGKDATAADIAVNPGEEFEKPSGVVVRELSFLADFEECKVRVYASR